MNRYKMKPGTTISDIEEYAKKEKLVFNNGGKWISEDAEYCLFIALNDRIDVDIAFPKDLEKWDDYKHVTVMDDSLGQPYMPFYVHLKNPTEKPDPYLKTIIEKYNKVMDVLPFLERIQRKPVLMNCEDPTKLPGKEINWNEFVVDAEPDDEPVVIPFEQDTDTSFDMFKLSKEEFDAL